MKAIPIFPVAALMLTAACGGDPLGTPPGPSVPPAPTNVRVATNPDLNGNTFTITWDAGQTPAFLVEIGHQPGTSNVAVIEVDRPPLTWVPPARDVDLVDYYVRVRGKNDVGIGPPSELGCPECPECFACYPGRFQDLDLRDFIEALLLGDGPLSLRRTPSGFLGGFPFGSQITVTFLNTVDVGVQRPDILGLTQGCTEKDFSGAAIPCAMGLTFTYSETSDRARIEDALQGGPRPPQNQIWVYDAPEGCTGRGPGFTHKYYEAGSPVTWAAIICLPPVDTTSYTYLYTGTHEMGHALGFNDLIYDFDYYSYMMRQRSAHCLLSAYEFAAVELAYEAGLRPGDTRQDFIDAGLIEP